MASKNSSQTLPETKFKEEIRKLRHQLDTMAEVNARAAETVAELETKREEVMRLNQMLSKSNSDLAYANAHAAELMAEIEEQRSKIEKKNTKLIKINEEKNRLLGMVSHDILGSIMVIDFHCDMLLKSLKEIDEHTQKSLGVIHKNCHFLGDLVSETLDVTKIEDGKIEPHFEKQSIVDLVKEVFNSYVLAANVKDQIMEEDIEKDIPPIVMDRGMINQVLNNLLSNAIKYTPKGGHIRIALNKVQQGCLIRVIDSGPGFTENDLKHIFQTFCKLSARPTGGEKSHGLGLAVSKKLIELHRGELIAENNPEGGACFKFNLPLQQS